MMRANEKTNLGAPEALDLVRAGKVIEATAAIQRNLGSPLAANDAPLGANSRTHVPPESEWRFRAPRSKDSPQGTTAPSPRDSTPQRTSGMVLGARFISSSYSNEAGARSYKLYVPSGYAGQAVPLIVMLHGCQQDPDDFAAGTCMNDMAEDHNCLVAYPAQSAAANPSNCWSWFRRTDQKRDRGEPSLIAGITREIIGTYCIDARQVFAAGLSAGGAMTAVMGATYPDLYAAIGVHSGLPYASAHNVTSAFTAMRRGAGVRRRRRQGDADERDQHNKSSVPMIVFHGDHDTTVHSCNGEQLISQWAEAGGRGAMGLRMTVQHGRVTDGHAYTRAVYQDSDERNCLEHWRVHGAGHAWSGGSARGSYTDPQGPDATREMLRFFLQNHKSA
jgi:poly(hydroxyalkanoate) depolymerase family esterase